MGSTILFPQRGSSLSTNNYNNQVTSAVKPLVTFDNFILHKSVTHHFTHNLTRILCSQRTLQAWWKCFAKHECYAIPLLFRHRCAFQAFSVRLQLYRRVQHWTFISVRVGYAFERRDQMDRDYDIFEILPDGSPLWKVAVSGHQKAISILQQLATQTENEVRIMHIPTNTLIASMNVPEPR